MARSLGSLVVSLGLDSATFTSGLTKAERDAQRFAQSINKGIATAVNVATIALAGLATAAIAGVAAFDQLVKQAGNFQDLAEKTGASAEGLASFAVAASVAGTQMEEIANFSIKLSKNLSSIDDESKTAALGLAALGISAKEFKELKPEDQIEKLAKALAKFNDAGSGKPAALEAIAKGGAQLLPFLKELGAEGGRQVILTEKQIQLADEYADKQAKARAELNLYAQVAATQALPAITAVTKAVTDFIAEIIGVDRATKQLKDSGVVEAWAIAAAQGFAFVVDSGDAVIRIFQLVGTSIAAGAAKMREAVVGTDAGMSAIQQKYIEDWDRILGKQTLSARLSKEIASFQANRLIPTTPDKRPTLPVVDTTRRGGAIATDDPSRKILEGQIKALEASIAREREILNARQDYLRDYYQDGRLSLAQFYDGLEAARKLNLTRTLDALNKEIALAEAAKAKAVKATDREGFQNQANAARERQTTLTQQAQFAEEALARDRSRANSQYATELNELNAKMLELAGNTAAAAAIRFKDQNAVFDSRLQITAATGTPDEQAAAQRAIAQRKAIDDAAISQLKLNDKNREYQLILGNVSIAQERINLAQSTGAIGEFEALSKTSTAATAQIGKLTEIANKMEEIANKAATLNADGSLNIVKAEQLQRVEELRLGIEKLAAQSDLLAQKFNNMGKDAFSSALQQLVEGTGTIGERLKKAALSFGSSLTSSINKAVSDELASKLFGKGGPASGFGDIMSKLFGTKDAAKTVTDATGAAGDAAGVAGATALTAAQTALATSTSATTVAQTALSTTTSATSLAQTALSTTTSATALAMTAVATAATAAASALAALAISSAGASAAKAIGTGIELGSLASGTPSWRGGPTWVGETEPELIDLPKGARVTPMSKMGMGKSNVVQITQHINVPQGANSSTLRQSAKRAFALAASQSQRG